ncbi:MAG: VirB3 family type IV secretion system protein [Treponema sp.]|jgi:type IV secretory pathway VirB3-like protein|nr:VirB3 family type IV secretion system protein [Treponema sp.]
MANLTDFSLPVHKSLQQPDLILGVPKEVLAIIVCASVVLMAMLGLAFGLAAPVFYVSCRLLSKEDPRMLSMALESLAQVDRLEG